MNKVRTALTRKIGPLPAWVWALALGALVYIVRNRNAAQQAGGSAADTAYYGPYGQDYYPIEGGTGSASGDTGAVPALQINIPAPPKQNPGKPGKVGKKEKPKGKHKKKTGTHKPGGSKKGTQPGHNKGSSSKSKASHNIDRTPATRFGGRTDTLGAAPPPVRRAPFPTDTAKARTRTTQPHPAPKATAKVARPTNHRVKPATRKVKR